MGIADDAVEIRARGWRTLASLHGLIDTALEKDLTAQVGLSVVEYTLLDALNRQDGWHMRMAQLSRVLCADDRRGIYTELTATGHELYQKAKPIHDATLERVLKQAEEQPELAPLARILHEFSAA